VLKFSELGIGLILLKLAKLGKT